MAIEPIDNEDSSEEFRPRRMPTRPARRRRELVENVDFDVGIPMPRDTPDADEDELSLRDIWRVLLKRRWTVAGCAALVLALALISALLETPLYRSTAILQIESSPLKVVNLGGVETLNTDSDFMGTQIELLKSRSLAVRTVRQMGLVGDKPFEEAVSRPGGIGGVISLIKGGPDQDAKEPPLSVRESAAVERIIRNREIAVMRGSQLVKVSYVSPDPRVAERVANGLAQSFMESNIGRREENSQYAKAFLEDRLEQLKAKLEESEKALIAYTQQQQMTSIDQNAALATENLTQLNTALGTATAERIKAEARYQQSQAIGGESFEALKSPVLDQLREKHVELTSEYESMRATFKPDYPEMQKLSRRIKELEVRMKEEGKRYSDAARAEYESAKANENLLRQRVDELQADLLNLQGRSVQYNILKRESDTNRQLYDALLQRYKEIGIGGDTAANNVSIVDPALPGERFKPNIPRSGIIGLLLGLLAGVALAFLIERLDDTLKTPEDVEKHLGLSVVGIVPKIQEADFQAATDDQRSAFSEAYRSLRTGLQYASASGAPKVLLITSSMPGEGKSTTAIMLAKKFAQLGLKVLLIDADLRKPSLHKRLNLANEVGLSDYLSGDASGPEVFQPSSIENLTVLTSGTTAPNPAELLAAPRFHSLLTVAEHTYDQVILDAPPMLGLADVPIMANAADGTLVVIEAGKGRVGVIRASVKRLHAVRARITGVVLSKYDARTAGYGYGYGYTSYYYDYSDAKAARQISRG